MTKKVMADIFVAPKSGNKKVGKNTVEPHMNVLSSFCKNPQDISFQTQKPHEKIILFLRSHFITNLSWIIVSIVLIIVPLILVIFLNNTHLPFFSSEVTTRFTVVFILLYYLIVFSYVFLSFLSWFYNVFIVTTERILDIDYSDIVVHNMAETKLNHIEDVRYTQSGFIPSFIDYGNLFVQTAGTEENFEAFSIPKPAEATDIITQLTGKK